MDSTVHRLARITWWRRSAMLLMSAESVFVLIQTITRASIRYT
jgi:hypothetical protein